MALIYLTPGVDVFVGARLDASGPGPYWRYVDDPVGVVDDTDYVLSTADAPDTSGQILLGLTSMPPAAVINSVTLHYRVKRDLGAGHGMVVGFATGGGPPTYGPQFAPPIEWKWRQHGPLDKCPWTDVPWVTADVNALEVALEAWDEELPLSSTYVSACYVVVDAVLVPAAVAPTRDAGSRAMRWVGPGRCGVQVRSSLEYASWPLLSPLALSHHAFPGPPTSPRRADRRLALLTGASLDLDQLQVTLTATELRRVTVADVDTCYSPDDEISDAADGVMRLGVGGRAFERAGRKWVRSPIDGRIIELLSDAEPLSADGYMIERERTNAIAESSLLGGNGGLTFGGAGTNGSAMTLDTEVLWFDATVVTHSRKFVAGSPHVADLYEQFAATATFAAGARCCVSVAHQDAQPGGPLHFAVQRGVDGKWWPGAPAGAWSSTVTWWPLASSGGVWSYTLAAVVDVGAAGTTLTLRLGLPAGAGAGQVSYRAHAQIEEGTYPSATPIVTHAGPGTRAPDRLTLSNDHGRRTWPLAHGSGQVRFRPLGWVDTALASDEERVLMAAPLGPSDGHRVLYRAGAGFVFERRLGGVTYAAVAEVLIVDVREYSVGWRWTGPEGDLGLAPYTLSIVVDGARGADIVAPGYHRPAPASATVYVGHGPGPADVADVAMLYRELTPVVLDDDELMDF